MQWACSQRLSLKISGCDLTYQTTSTVAAIAITTIFKCLERRCVMYAPMHSSPNDRTHSRRASELQQETEASSRRRVQALVGNPFSSMIQGGLKTPNDYQDQHQNQNEK